VDQQFAYNTFQFQETLVTQWNMVCDQEYKVALVISVYMAGFLIGSFACGWLGDKIGRKKCLMASALLSSTFSLVGTFMPELASYAATRFLTAIGVIGVMLMAFTMTVEVVGVK